MKCYHCGVGDLEKIKGYYWENENLGNFHIPYAIHYRCNKCGEEALPLSTCLEMEKCEQKCISKLIYKQADCAEDLLGFFLIDGSKLAELLEISKQAVSKNDKFRTLIYHCIVDGKVFYLKESAEAFKKFGSGLIKLADSKTNFDVLYTYDGENLSLSSTVSCKSFTFIFDKMHEYTEPQETILEIDDSGSSYVDENIDTSVLAIKYATKEAEVNTQFSSTEDSALFEYANSL